MTQSTIDVTRLVDEQRISAFTIRLLVLSFVVMLTDGYDLLAASYGAPALIADWHVNPSDLGPSSLARRCWAGWATGSAVASLLFSAP
jgi:AAHS family 4-hydroxybenzoate transporter-like MFS transporter